MSPPTLINVAGRTTRIRIDGDHDGPPVVLLHGIGRSLEDWSSVVRPLAEHRRVISLDLPGSGFSARRPERTTLTSLALGTLETLDALGETGRVHLIGNSLGGGVALQVQALAAHRVESVTLVNSVGFGSEVTPMLRLITVPVLGRLATLRTTRLSAKLSEQLSYADRSLATPARIEHALAISRQPDPGRVMHETARSLGTFRGVRAQWRQSLLDAVALHPRPTLVLWGDRDRVLPAKHLGAAGRALRHAQTHVFTDIGHMPQIECPDAFAEVVNDFLDNVESSLAKENP